jgi:hypothetical protein
MAFSPISFIASNYRDYKNNWLKAYEPGTTTPKTGGMATDSTLTTFIAKAELNIDGFIISAGGALITPYIDGAYDLWLFPNKGAADSNDTAEALRLANDITGGLNSEGLSDELISDQSQTFDFDNVEDMSTSDIALTLNKELKTKGRNEPGDRGGANYLVVADGTHTNGVDGHHEGYDYFQMTGFQISLDHNGVVYPEQFGWVGDWNGSTGFDNTLVINNMISYCAPYEFDTDVVTTRGNLGNIRASIFGGLGIAMVTDSVLINPFVKWQGLKKGAFFGGNGNGGTLIVGDFDSEAKYVADTAPMLVGGSRPLGATYTRIDFDGGNLIGCMGWNIDSVSFAAATGRIIKGAFNRQAAQQSVLTNCGLGANGGGTCYEGIKNSVCWGGSVSDNHIIGAAYAIRNENDVTTDDQHNNYCTISGAKPSNVNYTYIAWPNADLQDKTACVINKFSDPHLKNNTYEKGQIGVAGVSSNALRCTDGFFEGITEYIYAGHTVPIDSSPKWLIGGIADLVYLRGGSSATAKINLQAASYFSVSNWGFIESATRGLYITGTQETYDIPFTSRVSFTDLAFNGVANIYIDEFIGDDAKSGFNSSNPVLTIQEALVRCQKGVKNIIHLPDGQTIATKYTIFDGNVTSEVITGMEIEINGAATIVVGESAGQTHCLPMMDSDITLVGVAIDLSGAGSGDQASFLRSRGSVTYSLNAGSVVGTAGSLFGTQFGTAGHATITINSFTLGSGVVFASNGNEAKSFSWIESSRNTTSGGAVVGPGSDGKVFSRLFP